jgi:hypothetical protein
MLIALVMCYGCNNNELWLGVSGQRKSMDNHIDMGEVAPNSTIAHNFSIWNTSNKEFRIVNVVKGSECGCHVVSFDSAKEILPGQAADVRFEVTLGDREGLYVKRGTVRTTSPVKDLASVNLSLQATVMKDLRAIPSGVNLGVIDNDSSMSRELRIESRERIDLSEHVRSVESNNDFVKVEPVGGNTGVANFRITLANEIPLGDVNCKITITFDIPGDAVVEVNVIGRRIGDLGIIPNRLIVADMGGGLVKRKFRLVSKNGRPFEVDSITCPSGINVIWDEEGNERAVWNGTVEINTGNPGNANLEHIVFHTSSEDQSELRLPVIYPMYYDDVSNK